MIEPYVYALVALFPVAAAMVIWQKNPYQALVVRGILGAISALVYAALGGADVALTEALVGTMLAITLYAVAVRSSLVMRLGVLETVQAAPPSQLTTLWETLRKELRSHYLRLELVPYADAQALRQALMDRDVHATCMVSDPSPSPGNLPEGEVWEPPTYVMTFRVQRLYELLKPTLPASAAQFIDLNSAASAPALALPLKEEHP